MKTICIIPTHRNRYNFLKKTIGVIEKSKNIYKIIIINNGSTIESTSKINKLKSQKIKIINFKINIGSNAHIHGIKMALKFKSNKFIWLLDDDNLPNKNTLNFLIRKFSKFKNTNHAFTPIRYNLNQYKKYLLGKHNFNYYNNNFIKFNTIKYFVDKIKFIFFSNKRAIEDKIVQMAPFGGLFFHRDMISLVGLPSHKFFVYADDLYFTLGMTKKNIKIHLLKKYLVKDQEINEKNHYFSKKISDHDVFYQVRNLTYLSTLFIKNNLIFNINKNIFLFLFFIKGFFISQNKLFFFYRVKIILLDIKKNLKKELGVYNKYKYV